jgi:hypothetical protein
MTNHHRSITTAALACSLLLSASAAGAGVSARTVESHTSDVFVSAARVFANCTALNKVYRHGVGRKGARDRVSGSTKPVTNFTVNNAVYYANTKSDRDRDGIACEKR